MTTSNYGIAGLGAPDPAETPESARGFDGPPAVFSSPDAGILGRLAQELFAALSARPGPTSVTLDPHAAPPLSAAPVEPPWKPQGEFASLPVAPYAPPASGFVAPTEDNLRPLPASASGFAGPLSSSAGSPSPPSAIAQPGEPDARAAATSASALTGAPGIGAPPELPPLGINEFRPELAPIPLEPETTPGAPKTETPSRPEAAAPPADPAASFYFLEPFETSPWRSPPSLDFDPFRFSTPFAPDARFPHDAFGQESGIGDAAQSAAANPAAPQSASDRTAQFRAASAGVQETSHVDPSQPS